LFCAIFLPLFLTIIKGAIAGVNCEWCHVIYWKVKILGGEGGGSIMPHPHPQWEKVTANGRVLGDTIIFED
jgi:hypothetical protein